MDIVKSLNATVVAAIHDLNIAAMYCDRLIAIKNGLVVGMGTPQELLTEEFIYDMYSVYSKVTYDAESGSKPSKRVASSIKRLFSNGSLPCL